MLIPQPECKHKIGSRWFKVTLLSPGWRPLNHLKGSHFHHPKKVTIAELPGEIPEETGQEYVLVPPTSHLKGGENVGGK